MKIDRKFTEAVINDVTRAMQEIAAKHGLVFKPGRTTFSASDIKRKLVFTVPQTPEMAMREENDQIELLNHLCKMNGWDRVSSKTGETLVGYNARGRRYKFIVRGRNGKRMKASGTYMERFFTKPKVS